MGIVTMSGDTSMGDIIHYLMRDTTGEPYPSDPKYKEVDYTFYRKNKDTFTVQLRYNLLLNVIKCDYWDPVHISWKKELREYAINEKSTVQIHPGTTFVLSKLLVLLYNQFSDSKYLSELWLVYTKIE